MAKIAYINVNYETDNITMAELRELQKDFIGTGEVKGFKFHQVLASAKGYIYEVESSPKAKHHFEVFRRQITYSVKINNETGKLGTDKDKLVVSYPKSGSFGVWAWSCANEEHALQVYYNKVEKENIDGIKI